MNNPIVILGGGVSGLAAVHKLQKAGLKSILLEKNEVVGGLASSYKIKSYTVERFYHHIFYTIYIITYTYNNFFSNRIFLATLKHSKDCGTPQYMPIT